MSQQRQNDFAALLHHFAQCSVEFIIVGGVAAVIHGSARLTFDLDVVYRRSSNNLHAIVAALADTSPYLRGAPPGLPFDWSAPTLRAGLNFTLTTALGDLDLWGEVAAGAVPTRGCYPTRSSGPCMA